MRSTRSTSFSSPGRQGEEEERRVDQFRGDAWRGGVVRENALDTGMPVYASGGREKEKERDAVGQRETGRTRFRRRTTFRRFSSKPSPSFVEGTGGRGVGRGVGTFFIKVVSKKKKQTRAFRLDLAFLHILGGECTRFRSFFFSSIRSDQFFLNSVKNWSSRSRRCCWKARNGCGPPSSRARGNYDFESNKYLQSLCAEHVTGGETSKGEQSCNEPRSTRHANSRLRII